MEPFLSPRLTQAARIRTDLPDETLMAMLQARQPDALEPLQERHGSMLRGICLQVSQNAEDADELLLEILVETWEHASRYDPSKGQPAAWMATIARRRSIDRVRERISYGSALERLAEEIRQPREGWTHVHEEISVGERDAQLLSAYATLPADQQTAIRFTYHEQLTQREIATRTATPVGTITTRLHLGLAKMRAFLREFDDLPWAAANPPAALLSGNRAPDTRIHAADPILIR